VDVSRRCLTAVALVAVLVPVLSLGLAACGDDGGESSMVEPDEVYLAVIEWQLERTAASSTASPTTTTEGADLPVIYVAASDGSKIAANVQATVAHATVDVATVRFADARDEALKMDDESEPVRDQGILLSVAPIEPDATEQMTIEVESYRSLGDHEMWLLTVDAAGDGATITSSTLQPT
jgi:hypothetical protein